MRIRTIALPSLYQKKILWAFMLLSISVLLFIYIFQINSLTALAYHVADQEAVIQELHEANGKLEARMYQSLSFNDLAALADKFSFEKIGMISYIKVIDGKVAQQTLQQ